MVRFQLATFSVVLVLTVASAAVPSYIKVCGRMNPKLPQCIEESLLQLLPKLKTGIPELEFPQLEPLFLQQVKLAQLNDFSAFATNVNLYGLTNVTLKKVEADLEKEKKIVFHANVSKIEMEADYDVKAKILVEIHEKGPISTVSENVEAIIQLMFQTTEHRGTKKLYFTSVTANLKIPNYTAKFTPGPDANPLSIAINTVLVTNQQEIIKSMTPNIEKALAQKTLEISNVISKHFTYDELFPNSV